ncbi:RNA-binding protein 44 [Grus japonensis]|uniref:Receptor activity-modifying protein 1 n=1 Tax=Grus japonensis TaxID=30415 RepID=A0ABC9X4I4_GRUJA
MALLPRRFLCFVLAHHFIAATACQEADYGWMIRHYCLKQFQLSMEGIGQRLWCDWDETVGGHEVGLEERAAGIVYLDFSEAFDTISHTILTEKLVKCGLDEQTAKWVENWLNGWARRVVIIGQRLVGGQQLVVYPKGQC